MKPGFANWIRDVIPGYKNEKAPRNRGRKLGQLNYLEIFDGSFPPDITCV